MEDRKKTSFFLRGYPPPPVKGFFLYVYHWKENAQNMTNEENNYNTENQCCGSGSGRIRIIRQDPDPLHGTMKRIRFESG